MTALRLVVVGSGKIALDLASHAVSLGHHVCSTSLQVDRLAFLEAAHRKLARRMELGGDPEAVRRFSTMPLSRLGEGEFDAVIEATNEDVTKKISVFQAVDAALGHSPLLLSASSSLLPRELHPRAVGLHPFSPLSLTRLAELVLPDSTCPVADGARRLASALDLQVVEQSQATAFAINRLLLPWQCEAMIAVDAGFSPRAVDELSREPWKGIGALSFMDAVGLRTVRAAVTAYLSRMSQTAAAQFAPLAAGLTTALKADKNGTRNVLLSESSPPVFRSRDELEQRFGARLRLALLAGVLGAVERQELSLSLVDSVLEAATGATVRLADVLCAWGGANKVRASLSDLHKRTGLEYFFPVCPLDYRT